MLATYPLARPTALLGLFTACWLVSGQCDGEDALRPADLLPADSCLFYFAYDGTDAHAGDWSKTVASRAVSPFAFSAVWDRMGQQQTLPRALAEAGARLTEHVSKNGATFVHYYEFDDYDGEFEIDPEYLEIDPNYLEWQIMKDYVIALPGGDRVLSDVKTAVRLYCANFGGIDEGYAFVDHNGLTLFGPEERLTDPRAWDFESDVLFDGYSETKMALWTHDGVLFVTPDLGTAEWLQEQFEDESVRRLATEPPFQDAHTINRFRIDREVYDAARDELIRYGDAEKRAFRETSIASLLSALGLNGPRAFSQEVSLANRAIETRQLLAIAKDDPGVFDVWSAHAITVSDLPRLPRDVASFYFAHIDLPWILKQAQAVAERIDVSVRDAGAVGHLQQALGTVEDLTGQTVEELTSGFGEVFGTYDDISGSPLSVPAVLVASVRDAAAVGSTINELLDRYASGIEVRRDRSRGYRRLQADISPGVTLTLALSPRWAVASLSEKLVDDFIERQNDKQAYHWEPSSELIERLPQIAQPMQGIHFVDTEATWKRGKILFPALQTFLDGFVGDGVDEASTRLPKIDSAPTGLFPNASVTFVSDSGLETVTSTSAAPLETTLSANPRLLQIAALSAIGANVSARQLAVAQQKLSRNNLKQIGLALHNHADMYLQSGLPPGSLRKSDGGEDGLSWFVEIAPLLIFPTPNRRAFNFDADWSSQQNIEAIRRIDPSLMQQPVQTARFNEDGYPLGHYAGCAGVGKDARMLPVDDPKAGAFGFRRHTRLDDFKDGTANTLWVGEINRGFGVWSASGDATLREFTSEPYINGPDGFGGTPERAQFLFGDGSVKSLNNDIDPRVAEALMTINGGEANVDF